MGGQRRFYKLGCAMKMDGTGHRQPKPVYATACVLVRACLLRMGTDLRFSRTRRKGRHKHEARGTPEESSDEHNQVRVVVAEGGASHGQHGARGRETRSLSGRDETPRQSKRPASGTWFGDRQQQEEPKTLRSSACFCFGEHFSYRAYSFPHCFSLLALLPLLLLFTCLSCLPCLPCLRVFSASRRGPILRRDRPRPTLARCQSCRR